MTRHESPPFKMTIEGGKLVPATPYDAERLDTYRRGTKVNVVMVRDGGRVMERKWFAILGLVVKQCNVPWKNKDQASEAVKLALGIVNLSKTVGGEFMAYPKSLTELSDPELDDAVRDMMDLIQRMTGIDPATLKKEIADIGEDEPPSDAPTSEGSDGMPTSTPSPTVAADNSEPASGGPAEEGAPGSSEPEKPAHGEQAAPSSVLTQADKEFLIRVFKTMKAAVGPDVDVFTNQAKIFSEEAAGKAMSVKAKATKIRTELARCCGEKPETGTLAVAKYIAGLIGVDVKELAD